MAKKPIEVETLTHDATRKNIPTAEFESLMRDQDKTPIQLTFIPSGLSSRRSHLLHWSSR